MLVRVIVCLLCVYLNCLATRNGSSHCIGPEKRRHFFYSFVNLFGRLFVCVFFCFVFLVSLFFDDRCYSKQNLDEYFEKHSQFYEFLCAFKTCNFRGVISGSDNECQYFYFVQKQRVSRFFNKTDKNIVAFKCTNKNNVTRQAKFVGDSHNSNTTLFKYGTIHIILVKPFWGMYRASAKLI